MHFGHWLSCPLFSAGALRICGCASPGAALPSRTPTDDGVEITQRFGLDAAALRGVVEVGAD